MVKGLRSPDPLQRDLLRTYSASTGQLFWKLRWPASVPFLFASLKVAIAISLVGAIVGELPTGAQAGMGARLLAGPYYGQTVLIWAALVAARSEEHPSDIKSLMRSSYAVFCLKHRHATPPNRTQ